MEHQALTTAAIPPAYRLKWLDYSRGFTALLIVYAHLRNTLIDVGIFQEPEAVLYYGRIVTACTMPMFFFMSGNFIQSAARKPFGDFLDDKLRSVVYPYFLWSGIYFLASYTLGFYSPHWSDLDQMWTIVYAPRAHMWFFYTLFCAMVLFVCAFKLAIRPAWFLGLSLMFLATKYLDIGLGGSLVLETTRDNLPYFALGAIANRGGPLRVLSESPTGLVFTLLAGGYCISTFAVLQGWNDIRGLNLVPVLAGSVGLLSAAVLLERFDRLPVLAYIGRHSMEIYVAHVFGYQAARVFLQHLGVHDLGIHFALGMICGVSAPLALVAVSRRLGVKYLFFLRGFTVTAHQRRRPHASDVQDSASPG